MFSLFRAAFLPALITLVDRALLTDRFALFVLWLDFLVVLARLRLCALLIYVALPDVSQPPVGDLWKSERCSEHEPSGCQTGQQQWVAPSCTDGLDFIGRPALCRAVRTICHE